MEVEDKCDIGTTIRLPQDRGRYLSSYFDDEIRYHVRQCELSGLLYRVHALSGGGELSYLIEDLTPKGHEFLANIRKDTVWNGVKDVAGKVGSTSLSALTQIASNVIAELIKSQFGLI